MARNKTQKPLTEAPPEADSSEETTSTSTQEPEEEENSGSAASSSEEEETPSTPPPPPASGKKAPSSTTASAAPTTVASGDKRLLPEDDSSSSDEEDEPTLQKIKPISKSAVESSVSGAKGKPKYTVAALAAGQAAEKRASESELKSSSKKPRKEKSGSVTAAVVGGGGGGGVQEEGSKKLFQRVFSEDDEIVILKGMIDFKAKRGADPMIEIDDFYGFIKKSLHVEVSKVQIVDKVRRLKKKFFNAKKKKLTNPIEIQSFELSKKIWENNYSNAGDDVVVEDDKGINGAVAEFNNGNSNVGSKPNSKARVLKIKSGGNAGAVVEDQKKKNDTEEEVIEKSGKVVEIDEKDVELEVGEAVAWEKLRKKGLKMMGAKARAEIGEMWEKVAMKQAEAKILRSEAEQEETRRIMEALRSGKH